MLWVGPGALLPAGPASSALALAFALVGLVGLGVLVAFAWPTVARALRATVPHMFPFGPVPLDVALYLLVFAVVTCSTHAFFDVFTGADNGGQVDGLANQAALNQILLAASVVVYLATMYAVFLIARVVRLGRLIDHRRRLDPYRTGFTEPPEAPRWVRAAGPSAGPSKYGRPVLYTVSVLVGLGTSTAVQLLEVNLQPASPIQWLVGQAFTPLWALLTAAAVGYLDTGTRALEDRYVSTVPPNAELRAAAGDAAA